MFNFAVKFATWVVSPIGLLCLGSMASVLLYVTLKWRAISVFLVATAIVQLAVFAMPITAYLLQGGLEIRAQTIASRNAGPPYAAILLLGGFTTTTTEPGSQAWRANLTEATDRVHEASDLWHQGLAPFIIVSGGAWPSDSPKPPQAQWMSQALEALGVAQSAILPESRSTTTRENMHYTAELVAERGFKGRLALVTSASHLPRAMKNAALAGLKVDAFPTDWQAHGLLQQPLPWLPNAQALAVSTRALKEWTALLIEY
jgi:uncharacterized SAM-binding protein YcdF (DUF218 family)